MKITSLMGDKARTFIDWVGWLKTFEGKRAIVNMRTIPDMTIRYEQYSTMCDMVDTAQQFLSRPFTIDMVVRPKKPFFENFPYVDQGQYNREFDRWQNWKPLFSGNWIFKVRMAGTIWLEYIDQQKFIPFRDGITIDGFIQECKYQGITLIYNPEYEINGTQACNYYISGLDTSGKCNNCNKPKSDHK